MRPRLPARLKHHLKWGLIHVALLFFFADLIASIWPEFEDHWHRPLRLGVALAAFLATLAEYIIEEESHDK